MDSDASVGYRVQSKITVRCADGKTRTFTDKRFDPRLWWYRHVTFRWIKIKRDRGVL